jgi:hypothetical protein
MYSVAVFTSSSEEWCAVPNDRLFEEISRIDVRERWICSFKNKDTEEKIALGSSCMSTQEDHQYELHLPSWFLNALDVENGSTCNIRFTCSSSLPRATHLTFSVIGDIP